MASDGIVKHLSHKRYLPMHTLDDPIVRFRNRLSAAKEREAADATAMALATADADGRPSVRLVLLKDVTNEGGFDFYTNLKSRKAQDLANNPRASLCFFWPTLGEQVRIAGGVEPIAASTADAYFATRARGSQLGAWASKQSQSLISRSELEARVAEATGRFGTDAVPRPDFWGGFRVMAQEIEFWKARDDRLHDRHLYVRSGSGWQHTLLYP